jgi:5-bromo-4-chloroindolyl phosphate hydrolysis protein
MFRTAYTIFNWLTTGYTQYGVNKRCKFGYGFAFASRLAARKVRYTVKNLNSARQNASRWRSIFIKGGRSMGGNKATYPKGVPATRVEL